jgi:hypothetical protein
LPLLVSATLSLRPGKALANQCMAANAYVCMHYYNPAAAAAELTGLTQCACRTLVCSLVSQVTVTSLALLYPHTRSGTGLCTAPGSEPTAAAPYTCGLVCTTVMWPSGATTPSMSCALPSAFSIAAPTCSRHTRAVQPAHDPMMPLA